MSWVKETPRGEGTPGETGVEGDPLWGSDKTGGNVVSGQGGPLVVQKMYVWMCVSVAGGTAGGARGARSGGGKKWRPHMGTAEQSEGILF